MPRRKLPPLRKLACRVQTSLTTTERNTLALLSTTTNTSEATLLREALLAYEPFTALLPHKSGKDKA